MKVFMKYKILLLIIIIVAAALRFWQIDKIPPGLNRDEAAIGYTAYSLLKTGKDEYGVKFPLSLKSFGDWKLSLYPYLTIPPIFVFGLTEFAVRFSSALFGILTVIIVYLIAKELFPRLSSAYHLLPAALLAISPWHMFFSRTASEANTAVFFTALGFWLFLISLKKEKFFPLAFVCLALPFYTYHGNHIFTPFFLLGLLIFYWKKIKKNAFFWAGSLIFLILFTFISFQTLLSADKTKISGLLLISDRSLVYEKIVLDKVEHQDQSGLSSKIFHNKMIFLGNNIIQNYLKSFSAQFLFIQGGSNVQHNIPDFGNLYLWQAPFLVLGIIFLIKNRESNFHFLLWWLLISPIPGILTRDAPHSARMAAILPLPEIIIAYGVGKSIGLFVNMMQKKIVVLAILLPTIFYLSFFIDRYFLHFPYKSASAWGYPYKKLVERVMPIQNNYKEVIMSKPDYSPYIYFAFYQKISPEKLQTEMKHYPLTDEGFEHVKQLGNLHFRKIIWEKDLRVPNRLLIDWVDKELPSGATQSAVLLSDDPNDKRRIMSKLVDTIRLPNGQPYFYVIETFLKIIK